MSTREKASVYKDENSSRIYNRNLPTFTLEPYLSFTPMATKYNKIENHQMKRQGDLEANLMENRASYNQHMTFNKYNSPENVVQNAHRKKFRQRNDGNS